MEDKLHDKQFSMSAINPETSDSQQEMMYVNKTLIFLKKIIYKIWFACYCYLKSLQALLAHALHNKIQLHHNVFIEFHFLHRSSLLGESEVAKLGSALVNIYEPDLTKIRQQLSESR